MEWIKQEDLLDMLEEQALIVVVNNEEEASKMRDLLEEVRRDLEKEGWGFDLAIGANIEKIKSKAPELMDKIPVLFMKEEEYEKYGEVLKEEKGLIKIIPSGIKEELLKGSEVFKKEKIKLLAWKLWKIKMGEGDAIKLAEDLG